MSDETSRRSFLRWLGVSTGGAAAVPLLGACASEANSRPEADSCEVTGESIEGPFFVEGAPERVQLAPDDEPGTPLIVEGTIWGPDCESPIAEAVLDVWHASAEGDYYDAEDNYRLRGQMKSDAEGRYRFETIKPGNYPLGETVRPAHIHFSIAAPGYEPLTTQMYFEGDPHLAPDDPCGTCNSDDPTLIVDVESEDGGEGEVLKATFDIVLEKA